MNMFITAKSITHPCSHRKYLVGTVSMNKIALFITTPLSRANSSRHLSSHISSTAISDSRPAENSKAINTNNSKAKFYVPKYERGEHRSAYDLRDLSGETRLARDKRSCPTRELYFEHRQWTLHKSPYRKWRHMANLLDSAAFQRILFPDFFCVATVAGALTCYNEFVVSGALDSVLSMSPTAFAGATTAIGLLAGFRLNSSVGRVNDGRKAWSDVNSATRDLARQCLMWIKHDKEATQRILRLCQAFPIALMFAVNSKGCHHNMKRQSKSGEGSFEERVQAEFEAELRDVYLCSGIDEEHNILGKDYRRLCRVKVEGGNTPLEVITCLSETIAACDDQVHSVYIRELEVQIQRLTQALGSCERIVKTPLPTGFTRHSSRLLFIWSNCLPFAFYPILGPWGTLPASLLTSYAVLGIEDISVQLEDPFDILPLRQYSDGVYDSINAIERSYTPWLRSTEENKGSAMHE